MTFIQSIGLSLLKFQSFVRRSATLGSPRCLNLSLLLRIGTTMVMNLSGFSGR